MAKYIIKNALMVIPTMLCVVFIIFTINYFTPGDPVAVFYDFDSVSYTHLTLPTICSV